MSAVERAARFLEDVRGLHKDAALEDARALADAGLLAADEPETDRRSVSDGFGGEWFCCGREDCGLEVVRPGKVQCWCDSEDGPAVSR